MMRIGHGYDVHRLVEGRKLILCGVDIPHTLGLLGHSDADVATHAVADAILGATRLGDLGKLFPDTDPAFEGADSLRLLSEVMRLARERGYRLVDCDCTIAAQAPKLVPHRDEMRANLARALGVGVESVGVKATTTERLGFVGARRAWPPGPWRFSTTAASCASLRNRPRARSAGQPRSPVGPPAAKPGRAGAAFSGPPARAMLSQPTCVAGPEATAPQPVRTHMFDRNREDIRAFREHDPAATSTISILLNSPGMRAIWAYRRRHCGGRTDTRSSRARSPRGAAIASASRSTPVPPSAGAS